MVIKFFNDFSVEVVFGHDFFFITTFFMNGLIGTFLVNEKGFSFKGNEKLKPTFSRTFFVLLASLLDLSLSVL